MTTQKTYYPQLDAIRGISFLIGFFFHSYKPSSNNDLVEYLYSKMPLFIDVFFILSSFLLTYLGMEEYNSKKSFSFRNYFIRRTLRIWPLYFLFMFFSFVLLPIFQHVTGYSISLPPAAWYLFFVSNFYMTDHVFFLRILWTLSVEEQFYIFWGLCLLVFQKYLRTVVFIFLIISIVFNIYATAQNMQIYFHSLSYLFDMMVGAYLAYAFINQNWLATLMKTLTYLQSVCFYFALPLLLILFYFINLIIPVPMIGFMDLLFKFFFILYCGLMILDQMVNQQNFVKLSNKKFLVYTGKISFGLYCFHGIVISLSLLLFQRWNVQLPDMAKSLFMLACTYAIASVSYKFYETPFLKLKSRLNR